MALFKIPYRAAATMAVLLTLGTTLCSALTRFVARDEGYYLYAAKLLQIGALPYRDFFLPQTPLQPILYSVWFDLLGTGWYEARVFAALLTTMAGILLYQAAKTVYSSATALLSLFLYAVSVGVLAWLPTAQTNCVSVPLLLATIVSLRVAKNNFLAGAFFGFCVMSRLTMAPLFVVVLLEAIRGCCAAEWPKKLLSLGLGLLLPALATLCFVLEDPQNFLQHNLIYHLERSGMAAEQLTLQRINVVEMLLGLKEGSGLGGWQFSFLLYAALLGVAATGWKFLGKKRSVPRHSTPHFLPSLDPFLLCALILTITHLIPEPTYLQYFCVVQISLIAPVANYLLRFLHMAVERDRKRLALGILVLVCAGYPTLGAQDLHRYLVSGEDVMGVGRHNKAAWKIATVRRVSEMINQAADAHSEVFSSWPGYCLESRPLIMRGLESNFAPQWARRASLSESEQDRRKIISWERAVAKFQQRSDGIAVLFLGVGKTNNLERDILTAGGKKIESLLGISIFKRGK